MRLSAIWTAFQKTHESVPAFLKRDVRLLERGNDPWSPNSHSDRPCEPGRRDDRTSAQSLFNLPFTLPGAAAAAQPADLSAAGRRSELFDPRRLRRRRRHDPHHPQGGAAIRRASRRARSPSIPTSVSSISRSATAGRCNMGSGSGERASPGRDRPRSDARRSGRDGRRRRKCWRGSRDLPEHIDGGLENPLGARALYLFEDKKDTCSASMGPTSRVSARPCRPDASGCSRRRDRPLRAGREGNAGRRTVSPHPAPWPVERRASFDALWPHPLPSGEGLVPHRKHGAGRGDAAQGVLAQRDQRRICFRGEGARDEDGAVERPA